MSLGNGSYTMPHRERSTTEPSNYFRSQPSKNPQSQSTFNKSNLTPLQVYSNNNYSNTNNRALTHSTPYKPLTYKTGEYVVPKAQTPKPNSLQQRLIDRETMLKNSESIIDDIELYGLIATNDLLAIDRAQQRLAKADPTKEVKYFLQHIDKQSKQISEELITDSKNFVNDMEGMQNTINIQLERNEIKSKNYNKDKLLVDNFEKVKSNLSDSIYKTSNHVDTYAEKIRQITEFLNPINVEGIEKEIMKCPIDWERRKEMKKEKYAFRKMLDEYYDQKILEVEQKEKELNTKVIESNKVRRNAKKTQIELDRERNKRKYELMRLIEYVKFKNYHLEQMEKMVNKHKTMMKRRIEDWYDVASGGRIKFRKGNDNDTNNNNNNLNTHTSKFSGNNEKVIYVMKKKKGKGNGLDVQTETQEGEYLFK